MKTGSYRYLALVALCGSAVVDSCIHHSWRWKQNEGLFQQGQIDKDEWVAGQIFIPIESWGIGLLGLGGAALAIWRIKQRKNLFG